MNEKGVGSANRSKAVQNATLRITFTAISALAVWGPARAAPACEAPVARMASVQGAVDMRRGTEAWRPAALDQLLCPGDVVRVGDRSRAALLMSNQTTLRLDQHTSVTLRAPDVPRGTVIEQLRGIVNVITRTPQPFKLTTPFVNANVEGTEFLVQVGAAESSVLVYEGHVVASNAAGRVDLLAGEQASGSADVAPRKALLLRPRDAVQWAVHYPTVRPRVGSELPSVQEAAALAAQGRTAQALAALEAVPASQRNGAWRLQQAALLLDVGRADQALPALQAIPAGDAAHAESLALQAMVALAQNQPDAALALAESAVAADARATAALLALSYVRQARFELDAAAVPARAAVAVEADNALAWARLAELALYSGRLPDAAEAAQRAVRSGPTLSRAHLVHGYTLLAELDTRAAQAAFERAIALDQADPLPRMGLGLAQIREGRLAAGRDQLDIAVSLDPENALLRSYLGKAYAQERRGRAAGTQFKLAKERDPLDPTPWLYEAQHKLVGNRPVEALEDMERSIALNDNRAVVRSRLLLDDDRAERGVTLARIYDELGFGRLGIAEATKALAIDPGHAAAHRFLADAYTALDRHEQAVASESLQALLLQPVRPAYLLPRRSSTAVMGSIDEAALGMPADESRYFERSGASGRLGLAIGSRGLWSGEVSAAYAGDGFALDAGSFRYHTDGFRPNAYITHQVDDVLLQWRLRPSLNVQAEVRSRRTEHGDVRSDFSLTTSSLQRKDTIDQRSARLGLVWRPSEQEVVTVSWVEQRSVERALLALRPRTVAADSGTPGHVLEAQYRLGTGRGHVLLGLAGVNAEPYVRLRVYNPAAPTPTGPCRPEAPCAVDSDTPSRQVQAYAYWQQRLTDTLQATLGMARSHGDQATAERDLWLPKLGLLWEPVAGATLRAAAFRTVRRAAIVDQSIEPTSVVGFNQMFDDGTDMSASVRALGADLALSPQLKLSAQWMERKERFPGALIASTGEHTPHEQWDERMGRAELFWTPHPRIAARAGLATDRFVRHPQAALASLLRLRTDSLPLALRYFLQDGWFGEAALTSVRQRVVWPEVSRRAPGLERFNLVDFAIGRRAEGSPLTVTFTVKNLFGKQFRFADDSFRSGDLRLARYLPSRSAVLAVQTSF